MSVKDENNFSGRVNYAARVIASGKEPHRGFDDCFEMYDGAEVAVAVYRRSMNNPAIAANIWRYLGREKVVENACRLAHLSARGLSLQAAETRKRRKAESDAWFAEIEARRAAQH